MNEGKERFNGLKIGYWVSERLQEKKWFKEMLSGFSTFPQKNFSQLLFTFFHFSYMIAPFSTLGV